MGKRGKEIENGRKGKERRPNERRRAGEERGAGDRRGEDGEVEKEETSHPPLKVNSIDSYIKR